MRDVPRLRSIREERAFSQRDLAARSGVAHDTIGQLERGERKARPSTIRKLAEALGVRPSVLLSGTEATALSEVDRPRAEGLARVAMLSSLAYQELTKRLENLSAEEVEAVKEYEQRNKNRNTLTEQLNASLSQATQPQPQQKKDRSRAKGDKSLANRYKQYATPRVEGTSRTNHRLFLQELEARRLLEAEWEAAGKWAEYYVSGEAAYIPKQSLVRETEPTEDEKNEIRSNTEKYYLQNTLRLPSGTDTEEFSVLRLKLDSGNIGEVVEVVQKTIRLVREIIENLRKKQASFENIPDYYFEDHTPQRRIETLRTVLQQYREEALEMVHELLALRAEAIHRLDEAVDAMREEGEEMSVYVHQADI